MLHIIIYSPISTSIKFLICHRHISREVGACPGWLLGTFPVSHCYVEEIIDLGARDRGNNHLVRCPLLHVYSMQVISFPPLMEYPPMSIMSRPPHIYLGLCLYVQIFSPVPYDIPSRWYFAILYLPWQVRDSWTDTAFNLTIVSPLVRWKLDRKQEDSPNIYFGVD